MVKKRKALKVFLLSGGTGRTSESVLNSALAQFDCHEPEVICHFQVRSVRAAVKAIREAGASKAVVFHTVVAPKIREAVLNEAKRAGVPTFDVLGPALAILEDHLEAKPQRAPGLSHEIRKEHFDRIDAVDFTLAHDDGLLVDELHLADVVLVGVSRVSKSVTCFYLAYRGIRAANVPIVDCNEPPDQLHQLDPKKVVGLTMNARRLMSLREARLQQLGGGSNEQYVDQRAVARELMRTGMLVEKSGWHSLDVSYMSVEEVAHEVLRLVTL